MKVDRSGLNEHHPTVQKLYAEAAGHVAELEEVIVRHRSSGWVSEIARKDEDALIEAHFDPESGIVTVYEGRPG